MQKSTTEGDSTLSIATEADYTAWRKAKDACDDADVICVPAEAVADAVRVAEKRAQGYRFTFGWETVSTHVPCPVCGVDTKPAGGLQLYFAPPEGPTPWPVCEACGERFAPALESLRSSPGLALLWDSRDAAHEVADALRAAAAEFDYLAANE